VSCTQADACASLLLQLMKAAPPDAYVKRSSDLNGGGKVLLAGNRGVMGNSSTYLRELRAFFGCDRSQDCARRVTTHRLANHLNYSMG
jgi:hypothetical protein